MVAPPNSETLSEDTAGIAVPDVAGLGQYQESTAQAKARFEVKLDNFTGPFDLLLGLIAKHELDITDVAIATVTDEFIAYLRQLQTLGEDWALDEASEFLVLAATLLDLKAARLLPAGEVDSEEDLALLEARDLLFARLLQYKAFKEVAGLLSRELESESARFPRLVPLEPHFASLLPELVWRHTPEQFAELAVRAMTPKAAPVTEVGLDHLHVQPVSVREQAQLLTQKLTGGMPADPKELARWEAPELSFATLCADAENNLVVIARFLALLELFRDAVISFEQSDPLGELIVKWTAGLSSASLSYSDFDGELAESAPEASKTETVESEEGTE